MRSGTQFLPDNLKIDIFGDIQTAGFFHLKQLALTQIPHGGGNNAQQVKIVVVNGKQQAPESR